MSIVRGAMSGVFDKVFKPITEYSGSGLVAFNPSSLFGPSDQGIVTSFDNFGLLFQDDLETTPVTAVGQSVGCFGSQVNGHKFKQATASSRGVLQQDGSGKKYLSFDGVNDSYGSSAAIDLSGSDQVTVIAGVRKNSDAATGAIVEFGTDINSVNGSFLLLAPSSGGANSYQFRSRGTILRGNAVTGYTAPITNLVTGISVISSAQVITRIDGVQVGVTAATQGTGNYGNHSLFIGRRNNATLPFNGWLYAMIVINRLLTGDELTLAETWVQSKMGVA